MSRRRYVRRLSEAKVRELKKWNAKQGHWENEIVFVLCSRPSVN